jgi:FAD:protein FMN transferase
MIIGDKMKKIRRNYFIRGIVLVLMGISILIFIIINNNKIREYQKNIFYMDTYINVKVYTNNQKKAKDALIEIDNIYKKYHHLTDRYNSYDNIINIYYINNTLPINEKITIEPELYNIIKYSINYYEKTNGLVNIAIGNAIDVWKEYKETKSGIPTLEDLLAVGSINIEDIILYDDYKIEKKTDVKLDLGTVSKGYTTNIAGEYLKEIGLDKYLINAGGNVKVGNHYRNDNYKIGLNEPKPYSTDIYQVIKGNNISIVTSGSYERFYEYEDQIYHHIIDPNTLFPPNHFYSVTIITEDNALGDILSTALFIMNLEEGQKYVSSFDGVEAIWYDTEDNIYFSEGIKNYE